jgi:dihydroorotate dehydrogenase (fumarate)
MVGADVVALASALLRDGPERISDIETELRSWLVDNEYASITQLRASASQGKVDDPAAFERAQYIRALHSWTTPARLTPTV